MLVVVLLLAVTVASLAFGLVEEPSTAPMAQLDLQHDGCESVLVHEGGDTIDGNRTEIRGVADPDALKGRELAAGDRQRLEPRDGEIQVVWVDSAGDDSYVLSRFNVSGDGAWACHSEAVFTGLSNDIESIEGEGGAVRSWSAPSSADALGPAQRDLNGDGTADLPFVNADDDIVITSSTNETSTIAESSDIAGSIEGSKTRLGVGTWNGSDDSVFFVNENHDTIYRATTSGAPVAVATPGDGAQAISGVGDVDGDGAEELLFADGSQQLRYLEPDGSVHNLDNGQLGSNTGIGAGALADFDDDGTVSVVGVDGSNDLKIAGAPTDEGGEGTTVISTVNARKAPPTVADVDDDGDDEIVYVGKDAGRVKYVDDVGDGNDIAYLTDENGDRIDGSEDTGVV